jgi:hypothetical protein
VGSQFKDYATSSKDARPWNYRELPGLGCSERLGVDMTYGTNKKGCATVSAKAELARRVLEMLVHGYPVPTHDALQLRNWAVRPTDSMLPLEEIAHRILNQENPNAKAAEQR